MLAGVSQPAVSVWKHGGPIDPTNLTDMAVKLGVTVEWLRTGRGEKFPREPEDPLIAELMQVASSVDELSLMEIVRYARYIADATARRTG